MFEFGSELVLLPTHAHMAPPAAANGSGYSGLDTCSHLVAEGVTEREIIFSAKNDWDRYDESSAVAEVAHFLAGVQHHHYFLTQGRH